MRLDISFRCFWLLGGVIKLGLVFFIDNVGIVDCVVRFWFDVFDVDVIVEIGVDGSRGYDGLGIVVEDFGDIDGNIDGCLCIDVGFLFGVVVVVFISILIKWRRRLIVVVVFFFCNVLLVVKSSSSVVLYVMWVRIFVVLFLNIYFFFIIKFGDINKKLLCLILSNNMFVV